MSRCIVQFHASCCRSFSADTCIECNFFNCLTLIHTVIISFFPLLQVMNGNQVNFSFGFVLLDRLVWNQEMGTFFFCYCWKNTFQFLWSFFDDNMHCSLFTVHRVVLRDEQAFMVKGVWLKISELLVCLFVFFSFSLLQMADEQVDRKSQCEPKSKSMRTDSGGASVFVVAN